MGRNSLALTECKIGLVQINYRVRKVGFLSFIAMVFNCTAEMARESQKIDIVVAAVEKYLGV